MENLTDLVRVITALSTVPFSLVGIKIAFGQPEGGESMLNVLKGLGVGFGGPTLVYLVGILIVGGPR